MIEHYFKLSYLELFSCLEESEQMLLQLANWHRHSLVSLTRVWRALVERCRKFLKLLLGSSTVRFCRWELTIGVRVHRMILISLKGVWVLLQIIIKELSVISPQVIEEILAHPCWSGYSHRAGLSFVFVKQTALKFLFHLVKLRNTVYFEVHRQDLKLIIASHDMIYYLAWLSTRILANHCSCHMIKNWTLVSEEGGFGRLLLVLLFPKQIFFIILHFI